MLLLLASLALAQVPAEFDPVPFDAEIEGVIYPGILVDEATYAELGELRVEVQTKDDEILAFVEWKGRYTRIFEVSMEEMRATCDIGQTKLVEHYERSLKRERRKDWLQRHAFPAGVALGLVGATAAYLASTHLYGNAITTILEPVD